MFDNVLKINDGDNSVQGRVMKMAVDDLIFIFDDKSTDDVSGIDDLDDIVVNVKLKRDKTRLIASSLRLSDLFKVSDALGGYALDSSDDLFVARLPLGHVNLNDEDVLEVEVQNMTSFSDFELVVNAVETVNTYENIRTYESLVSGGENQTINNVLSVFNVDNYEGSATISAEGGTHQISSKDANAIANSTFELEKYLDEFGLVFTDTNQKGTSVTAKLPEGNYLVVGRL